ncbi:MAG: polymer-forming cytoskeletal protein [Spirochaetales bacterium]|nr:polymer-forming cytoskeletal protein [Spirochaetales bacterium]
MTKNNEPVVKEKIRTTLGKETNFNGIMRFRDSLKIDGVFQGEIVSKGFLYIESGATITADIRVGSIVIGGIVKGNVEATERLEILSTGQVFGNIRTSKLKIADGVIFDGKCEMIRNPNNIEIFSNSVEGLKQSTQSV